MSAAPLLAKLALVAVPVGLISLFASSSKAKAKGSASQAQLDAKSAAVQSAQLGLAAQLEALAPAFGNPDAALVAGVAKRIRDKTTLSGFGPNLFDPGPDVARGGSFAGGAASGPLRELQGFLLTLQGDSTALVEWSMAMGAQGFAGYAAQLRTKAEGSPVVPLGSGAAAPFVPPFVPAPSTSSTSTAAIELGARIADAIATKDPAIILALADELDKIGQGVVAERLRVIAKELQEAKRVADEAKRKAEAATLPVPGPAPKPAPAPTSGPPPFLPPAPGPNPAPLPPPSTSVVRRVTVLRGEGPAQVSARLLGSVAEGNRRFRELVTENVPPKKRDKKTGGFTILNPGEELFVPKSWPEHKDARRAGQPAPVTPPVSTPANPTIPPAVVRRVAVKAGEGPYQIAVRLLGAQQGPLRWKELVTANVPPKKRDTKTGGFTILNPGELLLIPESWPAVA